MLVLGVMSGSSLDGYDLAICKFKSGDILEWEFLGGEAYEFSDSLKSDLRDLYDKPLSQCLSVERQFNLELSFAVKKFTDRYQITPDLICTHGHTICHLPNKKISYQLGNGGMLSSLTGLSVVSDLRIQDVTADGEGTPLIPIAERDLFNGFDYYLNLGGIANISSFKESEISAFDICPCNQVLNTFAEKLGLEFDRDGKSASQGTLEKAIVKDWLLEDYFMKAAPKSLDNNWIRNTWIPKLLLSNLNTEDLLRNYVELIAQSIADVVKREQTRLFVSGGGAKNIFLMDRITKLLDQKGVEVVMPDFKIIDFKEAILMSYMGYLRYSGKVNICNQVTGAKNQFSSGALYLSPYDR